MLLCNPFPSKSQESAQGPEALPLLQDCARSLSWLLPACGPKPAQDPSLNPLWTGPGAPLGLPVRGEEGDPDRPEHPGGPSPTSS